jgi:hypothetical protein
LALISGAAEAHTRSQSFSTWHIEGDEVTAVFSIAAREITRLPPPEPGLPHTLPAILGQHLVTQLSLEADGAPCQQSGAPAPLRASEGQIVVELRFRCPRPPSQTLVITNDAIFPAAVSHLHFARITAGGFSRELVFADAKRRQAIVLDQGQGEVPSFLATVGTFIPIGLEHILLGIDHLAFILGLLLVTNSLRTLLIALTGFTLGHSLSLALAVTGYARADATAVETMIAATIGLVAVAAAMRDGAPFRFGVAVIAALVVCALVSILTSGSLPWLAWLGLCVFAFCYLAANSSLSPSIKTFFPKRGESFYVALLVTIIFGVIHGFGFAGALLELNLPRAGLAASLLGFNLGVELGQILVVVPAMMLARIAAGYIGPQQQSAARIGMQAALIGLGTFWFVTRALF